MVDENLNIEKIIKTLPSEFYASEYDLSYYKRYTGCDDFILSNSLIKDIWKWFAEQIVNYSTIGDKNLPSTVSIMHTNSGAGKILDMAPENSNITAFNLDYVCKRITDLVCQDRENKGMFFSAERDISQYFAILNTDTSKKYNIVITQPNEAMSFYKSVDNNKKIGDLSPLEYYIKRGSHFVNENGYLVVLYSPNNDFTKSNLENLAGMKIVKEFKDKKLKYLSYEALIFKK
jgi:hypothetical protein|tara:strand:+ start:8930 stop:9625 length:696 start_codon:yes stop_codon:yes gene_type:complete